MNLKNQLSMMTIVALIMLVPMLTIAQPRRMHGNADDVKPGPERLMDRIPNLTADQKDKIMNIHQNAAAQMLPLRNQINEKEASLQTLQTAKVADMKTINQGIDALSQLKAETLKIRAKAHQDVRQVLTDDQRTFLDSKFQQNAGGMRQGRHQNGGRYPGSRR